MDFHYRRLGRDSNGRTYTSLLLYERSKSTEISCFQFKIAKLYCPFPYPEKHLHLTDIVAKAVYIIYEMSRRQEVSMEVHSTILSIPQPNLYGTLTPAAVMERPGSVWIKSSPTAWSASI